MKLPPSVRAQFQRHGQQGGRKRAAQMAPSTRKAMARQAAIRRWIRARFGGPNFQALGFPGGEIVDQGLADLANSNETRHSLAVAIAAPRLVREDVPLPRVPLPKDPNWKLYRILVDEAPGLGHARYLATLERLESFANMCALFHEREGKYA